MTSTTYKAVRSNSEQESERLSCRKLFFESHKSGDHTVNFAIHNGPAVPARTVGSYIAFGVLTMGSSRDEGGDNEDFPSKTQHGLGLLRPFQVCGSRNCEVDGIMEAMKLVAASYL